MSMLTLGILQTGRTPDGMLGDYADYNQLFVELLGNTEFNYKHWPVLDNEFPASVNDADAWLITGSRHGAYEDHDWIPPLESLIREIYESAKPMVGICFGHQIIAQAFGGKVEKYDRGWSVGRVEYQFDETVFPDSEAALYAFHQDQVVEVPENATTVGSSSFCQHAALLYDNRILTIQPHPEFDKAFISDLLEERASILPSDVHAAGVASVNQPIDSTSIAGTIKRFLKRESA